MATIFLSANRPHFTYEEAEHAHNELLLMLDCLNDKDQHYTVETVHGVYDGEAEKSVMIHGISTQLAQQIAKRFDQEAIMTLRVCKSNMQYHAELYFDRTKHDYCPKRSKAVNIYSSKPRGKDYTFIASLGLYLVCEF